MTTFKTIEEANSYFISFLRHETIEENDANNKSKTLGQLSKETKISKSILSNLKSGKQTGVSDNTLFKFLRYICKDDLKALEMMSEIYPKYVNEMRSSLESNVKLFNNKYKFTPNQYAIHREFLKAGTLHLSKIKEEYGNKGVTELYALVDADIVVRDGDMFMLGSKHSHCLNFEFELHQIQNDVSHFKIELLGKGNGMGRYAQAVSLETYKKLVQEFKTYRANYTALLNKDHSIPKKEKFVTASLLFSSVNIEENENEK